MRYAFKRHYTWSPATAYSVGLIASDGCLQSDGRHIDLTSVDVDLLEAFIKSLGRKINITSKFNAKGKLAYRVQFSDVAYYEFLLKTGLTPKKSKTICDLVIPDEYYSHFLRGVFDGDGTTYGYHDPRWPSSYLFYTGFTSASYNFLCNIRDNNIRLFGMKGTSIRKSSRAWSLVYGKTDSLILYKHMYKQNEGLYLKRKKEKLKQFINISKNGTIFPVKREW